MKEIWLGELIYEEKVPGPRQFSDLDPSDNFTRANENPIGGNWTNPESIMPFKYCRTC